MHCDWREEFKDGHAKDKTGEVNKPYDKVLAFIFPLPPNKE